ncbi:hypothetical protein [Microlunatus speluncae]|uniref:hypothetical protein n=1 Tax=Microlunatus speluncae TaxID=2594267 RepID=UPI00126638BD|nr:hypothetical protein [Microlunatus speluncae]
MPSKLRTALGFGAATAIAATSLVALPTTASAGITCTTVRESTPVHSKPWSTAPVLYRLADDLDLACTGGPGWFRVGRDGDWLGYVSAGYLDTEAG